MPGLFGFSAAQPITDADARLRDGMVAQGKFAEEFAVAVDGAWGIGQAHLGHFQRPGYFNDAVPSGIRVAVHGELTNLAAVSAQLGDELMANAPVVTVLGEGFRQFGLDFFAKLEGAYCAVVVDERNRTVHLVNDRLGSYPFYWVCRHGEFWFAPNVGVLVQLAKVNVSVDVEAVGEFLRYGFVMGDRTLAKEVTLVDPGTVVTFDWSEGNVTSKRYFSPDAWFAADVTSSGTPSESIAAFNDAVDQSVGGYHRMVISLSGGLDSRAILSRIDTGSMGLASFSCGIDGCADQIIGEKLARMKGTAHRFFQHDAQIVDNLLTHLSTMVDVTDGMYLTHGMTEIHDVQPLISRPYDVLLRGHGGELVKSTLAWPFHYEPSVGEMMSNTDLVPYLLKRISYIAQGEDSTSLFEPDAVTGVRRAEDLLGSVLAPGDYRPENACAFLYLYQHHRRFTISSLEMFRQHLEVRMPFVDERFLSAIFRLPAQHRRGTSLHRAIIAANDARVGNVRNSNTGAPANASRITEFMLDKVNTVLRRMNVYGYRHYHEFERVLERALLTCAESELLSPNASTQGLFRRDSIERMVRATREGVAGFGYLLQGMLIVELWLRNQQR